MYSSGFAETGPCGAARQRALLAAAGSMPLLGPNCYGLVNYAARALIWPDQHGGVGLAAGERGVAVVSQSSSIAISVTMADSGLPLALRRRPSATPPSSAWRQVGAALAGMRSGSPRSG